MLLKEFVIDIVHIHCLQGIHETVLVGMVLVRVQRGEVKCTGKRNVKQYCKRQRKTGKVRQGDRGLAYIGKWGKGEQRGHIGQRCRGASGLGEICGYPWGHGDRVRCEGEENEIRVRYVVGNTKQREV